jgi:predicted Zn-dependent protease
MGSLTSITMKKLLFLTILVSVTFCYSQNVALKYLPTNKDSVFNYINLISEKKISKLGTKYKDDIKKIILERKKSFIEDIEDSTFVFDKDINKYLNSIVREITLSNKGLNTKDFYFFIDKSPIPNAACYGNGIFTINLGLFNFVNSDDELAFIISHEFAHYVLEHNDKTLLKYVETMNSKETKKKIRKVEKTEYGKRKAYVDLVEQLSYNFLKRSRSAEIQADSLGLAMFSRTKYNTTASVSALKNLDLSDDVVFNEDSKIREHFNFENYPFKEGWLEKEQTLFDVKDAADDYSLNKDSLKTHPDIPLRIEILNKMIQDKKALINASADKLKEIKHLAALLSISNFIDDKRVDFALYKTLVLYNDKEIDEKAYCSIVSKLFKKVYELKLKHDFGKYVSPVSPFSDEEHLNEVKQFLLNVELKNIKKIGLNFCLTHKEIMKNDTDFKTTTTYFNNLNL